MGVIIPEGYGQLVYRFAGLGDNEEMVTTIGTKLDIAVGPATAQLKLNAADDAFLAQFPASAIITNYTFKGGRLYVARPGDVNAVFEDTRAVAGSLAGSPMPSNCAFLMSKLTGVAGRRNRGRSYWPPIFTGESIVDQNGDIVAGSVTALSTKFEALRVALVGLGMTPVVLHSVPITTEVPTPCVTWSCQSKIATTRHRMRR